VPDETRADNTYREESIMPGYILMHAEVTDPEEYEHFKVAAAKAIEDHGGRYLVRGGASTPLEGDFGSRVVLLEFPSYEDALVFYRSAAYQAAREIRLRCAKASILAMDGLPTT
jgi:uncharacterized protein (DUF1330 family)